MRILIVLPRQERATGNEVTAERHRAGLVALGHQVELARVALDDANRLRARKGARDQHAALKQLR